MARKIEHLYDDGEPRRRVDPLRDFGRLILPSAPATPASDPRSEPRLPLEEPPMEFDSPAAQERPRLRAKKRGQ
jgi:hypothetical protein